MESSRWKGARAAQRARQTLALAPAAVKDLPHPLMPTAAASVACAAPRVSLRAASKRRTAIAKPPASRRSTRSCARGRAAELCPRVRLARACACVLLRRDVG